MDNLQWYILRLLFITTININILFCGCPLYDNETNRDIFDLVHKFIIISCRFD